MEFPGKHRYPINIEVNGMISPKMPKDVEDVNASVQIFYDFAIFLLL